MVATIVPFGSEVYFATLLSLGKYNNFLLLVSASVGNVLGSVFNWVCGYYVNYFMNNGITVTNILPTEKDAGDMGFSEVNKMLKQTKKSGFEDVISQKLMGI